MDDDKNFFVYYRVESPELSYSSFVDILGRDAAEAAVRAVETYWRWDLVKVRVQILRVELRTAEARVRPERE